MKLYFKRSQFHKIFEIISFLFFNGRYNCGRRLLWPGDIRWMAAKVKLHFFQLDGKSSFVALQVGNVLLETLHTSGYISLASDFSFCNENKPTLKIDLVKLL